MNFTHWIAGGAVLLCSTAAYWDLRYRRIPNALTFPAVAVALCMHGAAHSGQGLLLSLAGALAAGAVLLPGYAMRFTGAGDVKLLMAVGAFLAFPYALITALLSLLVGGLLSVIVAARRKGLGDLIWRSLSLGRWFLVRCSSVPEARPRSSGRSVPLGLAIAIATTVVVFSHWMGGMR